MAALEQVARIELRLAGDSFAMLSGLLFVMLKHLVPAQIAKQCAEHEIVVQQHQTDAKVLHERHSTLVHHSNRLKWRYFHSFDLSLLFFGQFSFHFGFLSFGLLTLAFHFVLIACVIIFVQITVVT